MKLTPATAATTTAAALSSSSSSTKRLVPMKQPSILEASQVYWLCQDYSLSQRNNRLVWYLRHFLSRQPLPLPVEIDASTTATATASSNAAAAAVVAAAAAAAAVVGAASINNPNLTTGTGVGSSNDAFFVVARDSNRLLHQIPGVTQSLLQRSASNSASASASGSSNGQAHPSSMSSTRAGVSSPSSLLPNRYQWLVDHLQYSSGLDAREQQARQQRLEAEAFEQIWFRIVGGTRLLQLACKYGIVVSIDVSSSMLALDPVSGKVLLSLACPAIERCFRALLCPIHLADGIEFLPEIYVSVIAQAVDEDFFAVLVHAALLAPDTIDSVLATVSSKMREIESKRATRKDISSLNPAFGAHGNHNNAPPVPPPAPVQPTMNDFSVTLQRALIISKLLPSNLCPSVILVTDGVAAVPDYGSYDNMIMMLNREDLTIHAVQLISSAPHLTFSMIPDTERLKMLAQRTWGVWLSAADLRNESPALIQRLLLLKEFGVDQNGVHLTTACHPQLRSIVPSFAMAEEDQDDLVQLINAQADEFKQVLIPESELSHVNRSFSVQYPYPWVGDAPPVVLIRMPHGDYELNPPVSFFTLFQARVAEGFRLHSIVSHAGGLVASLMFDWQPGIKIEYCIQLSGSGRLQNAIKANISVISYYEFLHSWSAYQATMHQQQRPATGGIGGTVSGGGSGSGVAANLVVGAAQKQQQQASLSGKLHAFLLQLRKTDRTLCVLREETRKILAPLHQARGGDFSDMAHTEDEELTQRAKELWSMLGKLGSNAIGVWHRWFAFQKFDIVLHRNSTEFVYPTAHQQEQQQQEQQDYEQANDEQPQQPQHTQQQQQLSASKVRNARRRRNKHPVMASSKPLGFPFTNTGNFSAAAAAATGGGANAASSTGANDSGNRDAMEEDATSTSSHYEVARQHLMHLLHSWCTYSPSKSTFVRLLAAPKSEPLNSQQPQQQQQPQPSAAFCVLKLTWEMHSLVAATLFCFGANSASRARVLHELLHLLNEPAVVMTPGTKIPTTVRPLFVSRSPLRTIIHRHYWQPTTSASSSSGTTSSTITTTPSSSVTSVTSASGSGSNLSKSHPPLTRTTSGQLSSSSQALQLASNQQQQQQQQQQQVAPPQYRSSRMYRLLASYLQYYRRTWILSLSKTRHTVLDRVIHARLLEGFWCVHSSHHETSFFLEISSASQRRPSVPFVIQYIIYQSGSNCLTTEFWMQPQFNDFSGSNVLPSYHSDGVFNTLARSFMEIDRGIITALATFDSITQQAAPPSASTSLGSEDTANHSNNSTTATDANKLKDVETPKLSIASLLATSPSFVTFYQMLQDEQGSTTTTPTVSATPSPTSAAGTPPSIPRHAATAAAAAAPLKSRVQTANEILGAMLESSLLADCSCELDVAAPKWRNIICVGNGRAFRCRCFVKSISESRVVVVVLPLVFGTYARGNARDSTDSLSRLAETDDCIEIEALDGSRFVAAFYECRRDQLFTKAQSASSILRHVSVTLPNEPILLLSELEAGTRGGSGSGAAREIASDAKLLDVKLREEHERSFVRVVYTQLRDHMSPLSVADFQCSLQYCAEYPIEVDITEYVQVLQRASQHADNARTPQQQQHLVREDSQQLPAAEQEEEEEDHEFELASQFARWPSEQRQICLTLMALFGSGQNRVVARICAELFRELDLEQLQRDAMLHQRFEATIGANFQRVGNTQYFYYCGSTSATAFDDATMSPRGSLGDDDYDNKSTSSSSSTADDDDFSRMATSPASTPAARHRHHMWLMNLQSKTPLGVYPFPFFARMEYVVSYTQDHDGTSDGGVRGSALASNRARGARISTVPVTTMPTISLTNSMLGIGSNHASSTSVKKAVMRVVCCTLPVSTTDDDTGSQGSMSSHSPSEREGQVQLAEPLRFVLEQTSQQVRQLAAEEVLRALQRLRSGSHPLLERVQRNLGMLASSRVVRFDMDPPLLPSTDYTTQPPSSLGAKVVSDDEGLERSRTMLDLELEHNFFVPLRRKGALFYAVRYLDAPSELPMVPNSDGTATVVPRSEHKYEIPYWLVVLHTQGKLRVSFHAPANTADDANTASIPALVRESISAICRRINQTTLLNQLHATRMCSSLLLPPATTDEAEESALVDSRNVKQRQRMQQPPSKHLQPLLQPPPLQPHQSSAGGSGSSNGAGDTSAELDFFPGQFECAEVYSIPLPLHARLAASKALLELTNNTLHPFQVLNRHNMFVYQEVATKNVVYLRLSHLASLVPASDASQDNASDAAATPGDAATDGTSKNDEHTATPPALERMRSISASSLTTIKRGAAVASQQQQQQTRGGSANGWVVLKVYGIRPPEPEVMRQFRALLENQLNTSMLNSLSNLLARNPRLKLTPADMEFLQPSNEPMLACALSVPHTIRDARRFIFYLQTQLASYLTPAHFTHPSSGLAHAGSSGSDLLSAAAASEVSVGSTPLSSSPTVGSPMSSATAVLAQQLESEEFELPFLYVTNRSQIGMAIGQGIAFIKARMSSRERGGGDSVPESASGTLVATIGEWRELFALPARRRRRADDAYAHSKAQWFVDFLFSADGGSDSNVESSSGSGGEDSTSPSSTMAAEQQQQQQQPRQTHLYADESGAGRIVYFDVWVRDVNLLRLQLQLGLSVNQAIFEYALDDRICAMLYPDPDGVPTTLEGAQQQGGARAVKDLLIALGRGLEIGASSVQEHAIPINNLLCTDLLPLVAELMAIIADLTASSATVKRRTAAFHSASGALDDFTQVQLPSPSTSKSAAAGTPSHAKELPRVVYAAQPANKHRPSFTLVAAGVCNDDVATPPTAADRGGAVPAPASAASAAAAAAVAAATAAAAAASADSAASGNATEKRRDRRSLCLAYVSSTKLLLWTYNWEAQQVERLQSTIQRLLYFSSLRQHLLSTIVHQKLGLFHHVPSIKESTAAGGSGSSSGGGSGTSGGGSIGGGSGSGTSGGGGSGMHRVGVQPYGAGGGAANVAGHAGMMHGSGAAAASGLSHGLHGAGAAGGSAAWKFNQAGMGGGGGGGGNRTSLAVFDRHRLAAAAGRRGGPSGAGGGSGGGGGSGASGGSTSSSNKSTLTFDNIDYLMDVKIPPKSSRSRHSSIATTASGSSTSATSNLATSLAPSSGVARGRNASGGRTSIGASEGGSPPSGLMGTSYAPSSSFLDPSRGVPPSGGTTGSTSGSGASSSGRSGSGASDTAAATSAAAAAAATQAAERLKLPKLQMVFWDWHTALIPLKGHPYPDLAAGGVRAALQPPPMVNMADMEDQYGAIHKCGPNDPVRLHASQLRDMAKAVQRYRSQMQSIHQVFKAPTSFSSELLLSALRSSRLLHFCRIPFLFHTRPPPPPPPSPAHQSGAATAAAATAYDRTGERLVQRSFLLKFRHYLVSALDFQELPHCSQQRLYSQATPISLSREPQSSSPMPVSSTPEVAYRGRSRLLSEEFTLPSGGAAGNLDAVAASRRTTAGYERAEFPDELDERATRMGGSGRLVANVNEVEAEMQHADAAAAADDDEEEGQVVYMRKHFLGGVVFLEIGVANVFVCTNMYALPDFRAEMDSLYHRQLVHRFVEECVRFKHLLHVNSFSYDFHLRELALVATVGIESASAMAPDEPLAHYQQLRRYFDAELLAFLLAEIARAHPTPPTYARNSLLASPLKIDLQHRWGKAPVPEASGVGLFDFLVTYASRYGWTVTLPEMRVPSRTTTTTTTTQEVPGSSSGGGSALQELHSRALLVKAWYPEAPVAGAKSHHAASYTLIIHRTEEAVAPQSSTPAAAAAAGGSPNQKLATATPPVAATSATATPNRSPAADSFGSLTATAASIAPLQLKFYILKTRPCEVWNTATGNESPVASGSRGAAPSATSGLRSSGARAAQQQQRGQSPTEHVSSVDLLKQAARWIKQTLAESMEQYRLSIIWDAVLANQPAQPLVAVPNEHLRSFVSHHEKPLRRLELLDPALTAILSLAGTHARFAAALFEVAPRRFKTYSRWSNPDVAQAYLWLFNHYNPRNLALLLVADVVPSQLSARSLSARSLTNVSHELQRLRVYACRRTPIVESTEPPTSETTLLEQEGHMISEFVNCVSYLMWRLAK